VSENENVQEAKLSLG